MASHHVLVLGGHGNIAQMMTRFMLQRSWSVTSMIRAQDQIPEIEALGKGQPGKLNVLVRSIEDVTSEEKAAAILKEVNPDMVAWSAGAGGKGGPERVFKIDGDAATHFTRAAAAIPSISRFVLISYNGSRREGASWWPAGEWEQYNKDYNHNPKTLANYYKAKLAADEEFYRAAKASKTLVGISLRPGMLSNEPATGITIGKVPTLGGHSSREGVAKTTVALLAAPGAKTAWIDMTDGPTDIEEAVTKVVQDGVDTAEGEAIYSS